MATARWRRRRGHFWTRQLTGRGRRPIGPGGPIGPATRPGSLDLREIDVPAPDGPPTVWNLKPTQAPRTGIVQVEGGNRGRYHTDGTARRLGPARRRSRSIHGRLRWLGLAGSVPRAGRDPEVRPRGPISRCCVVSSGRWRCPWWRSWYRRW